MPQIAYRSIVHSAHNTYGHLTMAINHILVKKRNVIRTWSVIKHKSDHRIPEPSKCTRKKAIYPISLKIKERKCAESTAVYERTQRLQYRNALEEITDVQQ